MAALAFFFLATLLLSAGGLWMVKRMSQLAYDQSRRTYMLNFPADLDPEQVTHLFREVSGALRPGVSGLADAMGLAKMGRVFRGTPSIVIETWGTVSGMHWLLKVPYGYEPMVRGRLEALIFGIQIQAVKTAPSRVWVHAVELSLRAGHRPMHIHNPVLTAASVRSPFGHIAEEETLVMQWVITPRSPEHKPDVGETRSKEMSISGYLRGATASRDEVTERRHKLEEPNLLTAVRVAAVASSAARASLMVRNVTSAFDATRGPANYFTVQHASLQRLTERITQGTTPLVPSVQLAAPELACYVGWPLGDLQVPGQPAPLSKRVPAPANVLSKGIQLGYTNYSGRERKVALGFNEALVHQHIVGPPGKGKTVLLANQFKQIVDAGYGAIVIEQKGDLFNEALNYIPEKRINDVIVFDVNDTHYPLGFNILRDGNTALAVDAIDSIFRSLYKDHPSLWANLAMYHGLKTLAESPTATVIDLLSLLSPTSDELDWAYNLRGKVKDPQLKRYWQELENESKSKVETKMEPINNRFWPIQRSNLVNILGQSKSSFTMEEVVRQNKILLVNLSGIDTVAAELMGAIIVSKLWQTTKAHPMPQSPNYLIMDEAHHFMNLPIDLGLMLVEARKFGLGLTFAHQGLYQLPPAMKQAVQQNMQTKIVFQTMADDARDMARVIGDPVTDYDISHLPQYDTWARVATPTGTSNPFTMTTHAPAKGYGKTQQIIYASRGRYGRPVQEVQDEILKRRSAENNPRPASRRPDLDGWGDVAG